jgi:LacI family transcriptional regulator
MLVSLPVSIPIKIEPQMRKNGKALTIQAVAKTAGVSVSTVSRVLNGKADVAAETVEKVRGVIQQMGYTSSLAARSLRSHHTNVIGMVIPNVSTLYCIEVLRGVNKAIEKLHYDLIIYTDCNTDRTNSAEDERSFVALLNGGIADGVIVVTPTSADFPTHAPVAIIDPNQESPQLPGVLSTNYEGALAGMNYLISLGHRRIGHITGRMELVSSNQRLQGYKDALCAAGIPLDPELIETGDYAAERAAVCTEKLLCLNNRPTAIFAANDMSAMGVYQAAQKAGLKIPVDLSVLGFDNLRESSLMAPALTTVDQSLEEMGTIATGMIIKLINGDALENNLHIIQTQLVVRDSCSSLR